MTQGFRIAARLDLGVDRNHRRQQRAAGEQHENGVGNTEGRKPGVSFRPDTELGVDGGLAHEAQQAAEGDGRHYDSGGGGDAAAEAIGGVRV